MKLCNRTFNLIMRFINPLVIIDNFLENRMTSTIKHNRARATHQINGIAMILKALSLSDWSNEVICKNLAKSGNSLKKSIINKF